MHQAYSTKHNPMQLEYFLKTLLFYNSTGKKPFFPEMSIKAYSGDTKFIAFHLFVYRFRNKCCKMHLISLKLNVQVSEVPRFSFIIFVIFG